jgi:integrase
MAVFKKRPTDTNWHIEFRIGESFVSKSSKLSRKSAAKELEAKWRQEILDGEVLGKLEPMNVGDACMRYHDETVLPKKGKNLAVTSKSTKSRLAAIGAYFGEDTQLVKITAAKISDWKREMTADGKAPATVDRNLQVLRAIMRRAWKEWHVLRSVPEFRLLNVDNDRERHLSDAEEARLMAAVAKDPDLTDFVVFMLDTGARRGDALQLEWKDVRHDINSVHFHHTKTDEPRYVPMTTRVKEMLKRHEDAGMAKPFPYDANSGRKPGSRVGKKGGWKEGKETGLRAAWLRALKAADVSDFTIHDLRHTFASKLAMRGKPLYLIGELLGHKDPRQTKRYAHLQPQIKQDAVDSLNQPLASVPAGTSRPPVKKRKGSASQPQPAEPAPAPVGVPQ